MGSLQGSGLNWDSNTRYTSAQYGDLGDGNSQWYINVKARNDAIVPLGKSTDAAVAPGANGNIIQLLKGLLGTYKAEDSTAASGDLLSPVAAVRRDSPTADGGAGDYVPLHVDALGRLRIVGTFAEDAAHVSGDYGNFMLGVASTGRTVFSATGDYTPVATALDGAAFVNAVPDINASWACSTYAGHAAASGVIKASAGKLFSAKITNDNAAMQYVMFFNTTSVPADATAPLFAVCVPAKSTIPLDWLEFGRYFTTGICWSNSSTFATKTIGAADCSVSALYL